MPQMSRSCARCFFWIGDRAATQNPCSANPPNMLYVPNPHGGMMWEQTPRPHTGPGETCRHFISEAFANDHPDSLRG